MKPGELFNPWHRACGFYPQNVVCRQPTKTLTQGQKLLYVRMVRYAGRDGQCFPGQEQLGADLGVSDRQVRKDLLRLEAVGLIRRRWRQSRRSNSYEFLWHQMFDSDRNHSSAQTDEMDDADEDLTGTTVPVKATIGERLTGTTVPLSDSPRPEPQSGLTGTTVPSDRNHSSGEQVINKSFNKSSSSSSGETPSVEQREDDEDGAPVLKNTTPDPEDVSELVRFIGSTLKASTGETVAVSTGDARRTRAKAPDWTIAEIIEGFAAYAKGGNPRSVHWFPEVLTDIHERLEGKPPAIPERCAHGLVVGEQCQGCEHDETERQNAKRRRQEAELEAQGICPACRNSGRIKNRQFGFEAPCEQCEAGRQLRAREDAEEQRRNKLADRFEPLSRRIDKLPDVKKPWEIMRVFAAGDADRREAICTALESECSARMINQLLRPANESRTA